MSWHYAAVPAALPLGANNEDGAPVERSRSFSANTNNSSGGKLFLASLVGAIIGGYSFAWGAAGLSKWPASGNLSPPVIVFPRCP